MSEIDLQLKGFRLTTAEVVYHMPDHHDLLQTFIWQNYDHIPTYPMLKKFLSYWQANLDGPLHSVKVAIQNDVGATEFANFDEILRVH